MCAYSASDHNTLRRHRMRHTGQKPYRCAYCTYTAIQAISLKLHVRTKHSTTVTSSTAAAAGATMVYSCPSCSYETVNHRSWLGHVEDHRNHQHSAERLFVVEQHDDGQLVLAPVVSVSDAVTDASSGSGVRQPDSTEDQLGLRHILTAISEQQQGPADRFS